VDWADIRPTEEFMQAIYAAIEGSDSSFSCSRPILSLQSSAIVKSRTREVKQSLVRSTVFLLLVVIERSQQQCRGPPADCEQRVGINLEMPSRPH
jgi:hypothetical protein